MELCESDPSEFCTLLKKLKLTNHQTKIMNKENNLNQIIENLILLVTSKNLPDDYQLITQTVLAAVQNKDSLITDIKAIKTSDNQNFISIIKSKIDANIEYTHIVELIGNALNLIMNTLLYSDGDKIGDLINIIRNYILVLIGDFRKSQDYIQTSATYSILNPEQDFWFLRSDTNGLHTFNTDNNYLKNTIPNASESIYSNAEIYNNPYTSLSPKCVIATPFPAEKIINENELQNYIADLFMNIPFAASHGVVFEAQIKVENLEGGSRGWGFWNTDALPIAGMKVAWFIQQQNQSTKENQFQIWTFNGVTIDIYNIPVPLDEEWHSYKILMDKNLVSYYMDNNLIHQVNTTFDGPMAFHNWVDNGFFDMAKGGNKVLQNSSTARTNYTKEMKIYTKN